MSESTISINVKGPSELKLNLKVDPNMTVKALKEEIQSAKADFPADSQRLIYSGKVLKDEETLTTYNIKEGHTLHMVRSATRSAPTTGNPTTSSNPAATAPASSAAATAAARGAPSNYATGQNFGSDPLAILNRADYAGPHMANLNPFAGMGINQNDPNMAMNMMNNPQVREQMRAALSRPEVIDQLIASNPQLSQMGPQVREMLRNPEFIDMLTDPETMQRMARLQAMMGGGGAGGMGAMGGLGGSQPGQQWPPPGTFGQPAEGQGQGTGAGAGAGAEGGAAAANPFAALGGMGGMGGMGGNMDALRNLLGGAAGAGAGAGGAGGNPFAALGGGLGGGAPRDQRPPEERYATQLEQMQAMGFTDGAANLRALLMSGGSIEAAMGMLFDDPSGGQQGGGGA